MCVFSMCMYVRKICLRIYFLCKKKKGGDRKKKSVKLRVRGKVRRNVGASAARVEEKVQHAVDARNRRVVPLCGAHDSWQTRHPSPLRSHTLAFIFIFYYYFLFASRISLRSAANILFFSSSSLRSAAQHARVHCVARPSAIVPLSCKSPMWCASVFIYYIILLFVCVCVSWSR